MARDLAELQQMITTHFVQRQKDDEELAELEVRIEKRQIERARQVKLRQDREKERVQRENEAKIKKEQEILKKKKEEEEARIKIINNISMNKMDYLGRYGKSKGNRKQTEREKKKKILGDRRKALNIDHLTKIKLIEKARELHAWMAHLEEEKYDFEKCFKYGKQDIKLLRQRVQEFQKNFGGGKKNTNTTRTVKTLANVSARGGLFENQ